MSPPAKSGPPNDPKRPQPKPAPRWLHFMWIAGLVVTLALLFLPGGASSKPKSIVYSDWRTAVDAGQVKTATIDTGGRVSGQLTDGTKYTSRIPTALNDQTLTLDLLNHHVTVKGTSTGTTILSIIGGLLPFILLLVLYLWISRRATRQLTGGIMGVGSSKAKVYDEDRPTTRFSDVRSEEHTSEL